MRAIGSMREVYGIRRIAFNEQERTLRVEYDGSHLSESVVAGCCEVPASICGKSWSSPERYSSLPLKHHYPRTKPAILRRSVSVAI
jgi:hypothetical protein